MQTRSSKYLDDDESIKNKPSRTDRNRYLYDEIDNGIRYKEINHFADMQLDNEENDDYQIMRQTRHIDRIDDEEPKEKVYDINSVLEEARKNRNIPDEVEKKRNLQKAEYSILADLNKKYVTKKEQIEDELEKENIRELIDTITSKNLPKDLLEAAKEDNDKDLMSDLMSTNTINDINLEEEIAKEILAEKEEQTNENTVDEIKNEDGRLVNSFYTRSMDLTEQDFDIKNEFVSENKAKRRILILVVLIVIVILAIVTLFILKEMKVI